MTKYGAIRTQVDGHKFASKAEARRYSQLRNMERAGEIADLELQPKFPLTIGGMKVATYIGDFRYVVPLTGQVVTEDVKGVKTPVYKLKAKMVKAIYGVEIREVS